MYGFGDDSNRGEIRLLPDAVGDQGSYPLNLEIGLLSDEFGDPAAT